MARSGSSRARERQPRCATPTSSTRRRPPAWSTTRSRRSPRRTRPCAWSSPSRSDRSLRNRPIDRARPLGAVPSADGLPADHPHRRPGRRRHVARTEDAAQARRGTRARRQGGEDRGDQGPGGDPGAHRTTSRRPTPAATGRPEPPSGRAPRRRTLPPHAPRRPDRPQQAPRAGIASHHDRHRRRAGRNAGGPAAAPRSAAVRRAQPLAGQRHAGPLPPGPTRADVLAAPDDGRGDPARDADRDRR